MKIGIKNKVSAEKFTHCLMGIPIYVTRCFSLAAFRIFSLSLAFTTLIIICLNVILWVHLIRTLLGFLDLGICLLSQIMEILATLSSNNFSGPFSPSSFRSPIMQMLFHFLLPPKSLKLSSLFFFFSILLLCLGEFHCFVFCLLIHSSSSSSLLLNPSSAFFIQLQLLFGAFLI